MLYPVLPIFLTQVLHASGSVVGFVEGIAKATQNVVQGLSGWLSDKLHKWKAGTNRLRPSAVGWYSAIAGLLELVASVVAGFLWDRVSHAAVFYYGAIFALAGSFGLLFIPGKRNRSAVYD